VGARLNEAIWYVVGDEVLVLCGALLALFIVLSVFSILFAPRFDFWGSWDHQKGGAAALDSE
jgi:hypothetical protein